MPLPPRLGSSVVTLLMGLLCCVQDVKLGGVVVLELARAITSCVVPGATEQTLTAVAKALSCDDGVLGPYYAFLAVVRDVPVSRSGRAVFAQAPLLTVVSAVQSLASATDGARNDQDYVAAQVVQQLMLPYVAAFNAPRRAASAGCRRLTSPAHAATPGWQPARQLVIDVLDEVLDIQTGVEQLAERDQLISPIGWRLRLQIVSLLVSRLSCCTMPVSSPCHGSANAVGDLSRPMHTARYSCNPSQGAQTTPVNRSQAAVMRWEGNSSTWERDEMNPETLFQRFRCAVLQLVDDDCYHARLGSIALVLDLYRLSRDKQACDTSVALPVRAAS